MRSIIEKLYLMVKIDQMEIRLSDHYSVAFFLKVNLMDSKKRHYFNGRSVGSYFQTVFAERWHARNNWETVKWAIVFFLGISWNRLPMGVASNYTHSMTGKWKQNDFSCLRFKDDSDWCFHFAFPYFLLKATYNERTFIKKQVILMFKLSVRLILHSIILLYVLGNIFERNKS